MKVRPSCALGLSVIGVAALLSAQTAHAAVIPLLASGQQSFSANSTNTVFSLTDIQPAGSGVFNPFVRIEALSGGGPQQGYNTFETQDTMENHPNGPADPLIHFNTVVDEDRHINLALDYNEPGNVHRDIVLEDLILVVSTNPNKSGPAGTDPFSILSIPSDPGDVTLYTMSATTRTDAGHVGESFTVSGNAGDNLANGNGGSGTADMLVQIDLSGIDFSALYDGEHYLYVYSRFSGAESGFEEWRIETPNNPFVGTGIPEPASLGLLGTGAMGLLVRRRKA